MASQPTGHEPQPHGVPQPPPPPAPSAADKAKADKAAAEQREASIAASIGAQVILDFNESGSQGARGGYGPDIESNVAGRDEHLVALGFDPAAPSGPPPSPEVLKAKKAKEEEAAKAQEAGPKQSPKATKVSSLAADLNASPAGGGGQKS